MANTTNVAPVCFILAPDYHGAEMLASSLNTHPDIFAPGSTNPIRGMAQKCSCGEDVETCPFWIKMRESCGAEEDDPLPNMLPQSPYLTANERLNNWLCGIVGTMAHAIGAICWKLVYEQAERFFRAHERFLSAARVWTPHKIFVDGERSNIKLLSMASMGFPTKGIIHITRDPRTICAIGKRYYPEIPVETMAHKWLAAHKRIRGLAVMFPAIPYIRVKFEDIMDDAAEVSERIRGFMGLNAQLPVSTVEAAYKNHMIAAEGASAPWITENAPETAVFELSEDDEMRILRVVGRVFDEFGYKREN